MKNVADSSAKDRAAHFEIGVVLNGVIFAVADDFNIIHIKVAIINNGLWNGNETAVNNRGVATSDGSMAILDV